MFEFKYCVYEIPLNAKLPVPIMLPHFQFYTKLEEKHQALEAQKNQSEARTKVGYFLKYLSSRIFSILSLSLSLSL